MKVVFTVATYEPSLDGVQFVTKYLAEGLAQKGIEVLVITQSRTRIPSSSEEIINGVIIKRIDVYTKHQIDFGSKIEYQKLVLDSCKDADCLINVCTQTVTTNWCFGILDKINCKKILYIHSIIEYKYHKYDFTSLKTALGKIWANVRYKYYYNINGKYFKMYDYVTQLHQNDYSTKYFKKKYNIDSIVIENAADESFFNDEIQHDFKKPFDKYLINVANYCDRKNQKLAISSFLNANIPNDIGLVLIGSKENSYLEEMKKLEMKIKKNKGIKDNEKPILYLPGLERRLVSSYVKSSYLYLMPSKWEAFPISLVESQAAGIPFISTNVGIVKYFNGGIISSMKDFKKNIEYLFNNNELYLKLSCNGKNEAIAKMKIDKKVDQLNNLIKNKGGSEK